MKNLIYFFSLVLLTVLLPLTTPAQDLPYTEGTVWNATFVRTKPGMGDEYLKNLAANWKKQNEEFKKAGLILSYKILSGSASNKEDWDLMLLIEYKNMAALDGLNEKMNSIMTKMSSEKEMKEGYAKRSDMREILGNKMLQEISLK